MTDNVDAVCGSRSNPQDYEGVEDMLLNPKLRCNSKACRYRHGTDFQAGLKIARTGPCRYRHGPDVEAGLNLPVVSRIRTPVPVPEAMEQYFKKMPLKIGDDECFEWFNKSWPESESEEEDSRQTAGEATMGASTARRRSEPEEQGTPSNNDDSGKCLVH